jgi:aminoglycoside/choline kinase family phosphotransferase
MFPWCIIGITYICRSINTLLHFKESANLNMIQTHYQKGLENMFREWSGQDAESIELLPGSGSGRRYYRLKAGTFTALGAYNHDARENNAFLSFTEQLLRAGLAVPKIYASDPEQFIYLLQDLGDETLFSFLSNRRLIPGSANIIKETYQKVIDCLPQFQIKGGAQIDYSVCYPRDVFDRQSMMWDLNYFKYYFLRLAKIRFDEQELENDFEVFSSYLNQAPQEHFLYRDFQSRNIMLYDNAVYFIDYQGGRKGALQYDIASLLWDAKADLSMELRKELFQYYLKVLSNYKQVDNKSFTETYYAFVYIRILQALGAYGYRGFYERKEHFLLSIPYAVNNLKWLLEHAPLPVNVPALQHCLEAITQQESLQAFVPQGDKLTLHIHSFSYKNGLPQDLSGNGGGFVFDCRALPNPGRYKEYKQLTGKDAEVKTFLEAEQEVLTFFENTCKLVEQSAENYIMRGFSSLMVSYGCTGGQHRSVWCAEQLKKHLEGRYDMIIKLSHKEL